MTRFTPDDGALLNLGALDAEDLAILSAHVQDAILKPADIVWRPRSGQLILTLRRFDWNSPAGSPRRRLATLHFNRVTHVAQRGVAPDAEALSLLTMAFEEGEAPSGLVHLTFSGGGAIRIAVECIEAHLKDMGPQWSATSRPAHALDEDQ